MFDMIHGEPGPIGPQVPGPMRPGRYPPRIQHVGQVHELDRHVLCVVYYACVPDPYILYTKYAPICHRDTHTLVLAHVHIYPIHMPLTYT